MSTIAENLDEVDATRWSGVLSASFSMLCAGLVWGMFYPFYALVLNSRGSPGWVIGSVLSVMAIGILFASPIAPGLARRFGAVATKTGGALLAGVSIAAFAVFDSIFAWLALAAVTGVAYVCFWSTADAWISHSSSALHRGKLVALYNTCYTGGLAIGPLVLPLVGTDSPALFYLIGMVMALPAVTTPLARRSAPLVEAGTSGSSRTRFMSLFAAVPVLFVAVFVSGFAEGGFYTIFPVYGVERSLDPAGLAFLISIYGFGGMLLQLPAGWLADHVSPYVLLTVEAVIGIVCPLAVTVLWNEHLALWAVVFVWGGVMTVLRVFGLIIIGRHFQGMMLQYGVASLIAAYTIGTLAGPIASGASLDLWRPHGLMAALLLVSIVLLIFTMRFARALNPPGHRSFAGEQSAAGSVDDFRPAPTGHREKD